MQCRHLHIPVRHSLLRCPRIEELPALPNTQNHSTALVSCRITSNDQLGLVCPAQSFIDEKMSLHQSYLVMFTVEQEAASPLFCSALASAARGEACTCVSCFPSSPPFASPAMPRSSWCALEEVLAPRQAPSTNFQPADVDKFCDGPSDLAPR